MRAAISTFYREACRNVSGPHRRCAIVEGLVVLCDEDGLALLRDRDRVVDHLSPKVSEDRPILLLLLRDAPRLLVIERAITVLLVIQLW